MTPAIRQIVTLSVVSLVLFACACSKVPDLSGLTQQQAQDALTKKKLTMGSVTTANLPNKTAGTVISQDPAPDAKIPDNKTVAIVLQQGVASNTGNGGATNTNNGNANSGLVPVPDLVGKTQDEATALLVGNGLSLGNVAIQIVSHPAGKVYEQDPPANTQVPPGTTMVNVSIASDANVQVPSVVGQAQADAEKAIQAAQLQVVSVPVIDGGAEPVGSVFEQNPSAALTVAKGQTVTLKVKQDSVTVPYVVGQDRNQAQLALFQAGLTPDIQLVFGDLSNINKVISQGVPQNTAVPRYQKVKLVVGGLRIVPIPGKFYVYNHAVTTIQHH